MFVFHLKWVDEERRERKKGQNGFVHNTTYIASGVQQSIQGANTKQPTYGFERKFAYICIGNIEQLFLFGII